MTGLGPGVATARTGGHRATPDPTGCAEQPVRPPGSPSEPYPLALFTPAEAAAVLRVPESWLRRKAGRRVIPCTFFGRHLRFSTADLIAITAHGERPARGSPLPRHRR